MKHWQIDYTIKYKSGRKQDGVATIEANNIVSAMASALSNIRKPMIENPEVEDLRIWDIGIVEESVFEEDEDDQENHA